VNRVVYLAREVISSFCLYIYILEMLFVMKKEFVR
jgi:hypothetical protein